MKDWLAIRLRLRLRRTQDEVLFNYRLACQAFPSEMTGAPDRIRTCGLQIRNLLLYPTELRAPNTVIRISFLKAPVTFYQAIKRENYYQLPPPPPPPPPPEEPRPPKPENPPGGRPDDAIDVRLLYASVTPRDKPRLIRFIYRGLNGPGP